jgi:dienelactone hydrolase
VKRRHLLLSALAAAALPLRADEAFDTLDLDWRDAARDRPVPVRLYRPRAGAGWPLVVFSHGIGGSRLGYGYLGRHLAANGVASLHLQHSGSDRALWSGNPFALVGRLQAAAQDGEAIARVHDLGFALDRLQAGPLGDGVDGARIVVAGHSYGANTALLAAGATVWREGRPLSLRDPRVRAAIAISAPPFYGEGDPQAILRAVAVPSLHVTTTDDVIRIPGYYSAPEDRLAVYDATGGGSKVLAQFNRGRHSTFVGRGGDGEPVLAATRELALAFVQRTFGLPGGDLPAWRQRHAPLVERFVAA